jgi:3-hydroxyacyl-[acyl-carrier-protein] dehydratase
MIALSEVFNTLPHRYPMLLVDRVVDLEPNRLIAIKAVSGAEPWYQGLDAPTEVTLEYPSALVLESWCQAAALLVLAGRSAQRRTVILGRVSDVTFQAPVLPGDVLKHRVELSYRSEHTFVLTGDVLVVEEIVAKIGSVVIALREPAEGGERDAHTR